ncbi:neopentalenolactone/pentalenolactone D synthase [Kitasatospora sp. SUK 42]|uniref:neopentalenolactone/pentalenolactone D synthase n=1 Tax=Kitasatospora sp. SUK 42 TaxID=1588882 RepID=UPI0018CB645A|nr:NAD(P)/FAD-dependent oxidoreductase [Kitasatospora sp. SUK 42]MBV2156772.1 NAD(P)/FAD-dependent oxidoreductase [Kitasatospora sp. SUK 42]
MRARYREERDKRLGTGRGYQYARGDFAHYAADPNAAGHVREPVTDEVDVTVVGAGLGGLLVGARLREQCDFETIRLVDAAGDVGGTWYWNRFPGLRCDVESYVYMPLLEELGTVPAEKYASGEDILAHCQAVARHYGLYRDALLGTSVTELRWDEPTGFWTVTTDRGDRFRSRYVCMAIGSLHRPKLPELPGLDEFAGHSFHAARWDYDYTGGGVQGSLEHLRDKRVGVVGTGATAVQIIPRLAEAAGHLYVFQRTPSAVGVRANRPTDPAWAAGLQPGWQQRRMDNFHLVTSGKPQDEDLVQDGWTEITAKLAAILPRQGAAPADPAEAAAAVEHADLLKMEEIRERVATLVHDPATAAALMPYYRMFCKRPCFHDGYLETFNRPDVTLVDTEGRGVERLTGAGVLAGGREYPVDCLVFASGYESEFAVPYVERAGFDVIGRDGLRLSQKWAEGVRTLHGLQTHGFPNCFVLAKAQSGLHVNAPYMLNEQSRHLAHVLAAARKRGHRVVEASAAAEREWVEEILRLANRNLDYAELCTPGLFNNEGRPGELHLLNASYGGGSVAFVDILRRCREDDVLAGIELRDPTTSTT